MSSEYNQSMNDEAPNNGAGNEHMMDQNSQNDDQNYSNNDFSQDNNNNGNDSQDGGNYNGNGNMSQDDGHNQDPDGNGNTSGNEDGHNGNNNHDDENAPNSGAPMEPEQFRKVFIGGLSYKTDDDALKAYFSKYGELVDHVVMKDSQTGRSRGFGFVTYSNSSMVDELMKNRPHIIDGRQVEPKRATPREVGPSKVG